MPTCSGSVETIEDLDGQVDAHAVAEHFEVPLDVAADALGALVARLRKAG